MSRLTDTRKELQKIVDSIPTANFGKVKVQINGDTLNELFMRTFSPADAVRIIAGLREKGINAHGYTYDSCKVGVPLWL